SPATSLAASSAARASVSAGLLVSWRHDIGSGAPDSQCSGAVRHHCSEWFATVSAQDERPREQIRHVPLSSVRQRYEPQLSRFRGSDTAKAAGLAGAMVANNVIALGSVIVFSRELTDYGSLAALVSYFLILAV